MTSATVRLAPPPGAAPTHDLGAALAEVDRRLGTGVARTLDGPPPVAAISTGSLPLDLALGVGGVPRGRITEIYGPEGAGKTTLALSVIAHAQQHGGTARHPPRRPTGSCARRGRGGLQRVGTGASAGRRTPA